MYIYTLSIASGYTRYNFSLWEGGASGMEKRTQARHSGCAVVNSWSFLFGKLRKFQPANIFSQEK